ncbi:hypothetical protein ACFVZR_06985 [Streptomyces sp. NPDC058316]|uniref:hypothetical protein n=1 Tax=unclassified Streptomyces TaxID=2593676 RepID=UPI00332610E1
MSRPVVENAGQCRIRFAGGGDGFRHLKGVRTQQVVAGETAGDAFLNEVVGLEAVQPCTEAGEGQTGEAGGGQADVGPVCLGELPEKTWVKTWTPVKWKSRAWCSDFAKYTWYWGGAKVTGLNASAGSFRSYGLTNHAWHSRADVAETKGAKGACVPKKGDVVSYDWDRDGVIDHVGVLTAYSTKYKAYFSVEGNSGEKLNYKNTKQSAVAPYVVGYTSPKKLRGGRAAVSRYGKGPHPFVLRRGAAHCPAGSSTCGSGCGARTA